ncbi:hypothetical protein ACKWTF_001327 [Chironomus riparius]
MTNPLNSYINLARIVFSAEPAEPNEVWDEFEEFEEKLREFYENLLCKNCKQLLNDPVTPKKQHLSCHHRVCLDCIGKNRSTTLNCKMCRDFTLFEKSSQTKLVLRLYNELCELIKGSWIYDYIQRRTNHDTGQESLVNIIEYGVNYGRSSCNTAMIQDDSPTTSSSSDDNSNSSSVMKPIQNIIIKKEKSPQVVPYTYHPQTFPTISPLPPYSPISTTIVQSPEQFHTQEIIPIAESPQIPKTPPIITVTTQSPAPTTTFSPSPNITQISQIVQYSAPTIVQSSIPTITSKPQIQPQQLPVPNQQSSSSLLKTSQFISHVPMRVKSIAQQAPTQINTTKSIMSPMKIQQTAPTIYSVMYTGSGNKITLKRKAPDDNASIPITSDLSASSNNTTTIVKTENFKTPPVQIATQQIPIIVPTSTSASFINTSTTQTSTSSLLSLNINDQQKRRGCRCGNATAAPGKLTCCGQRCPCYVDSKACIDCKCKGCRNPHYVDGHKKMRHQVPDLQTQQLQQQSFLASIQQQTAMLKEVHKTTGTTPMTAMIKTEDMNLVESTIITKSQNSINNCIISMNSNGQYQIKPRIIMKEPVKATMSPLIFPTTSTTTGQIGNSNSSIQIVGLYSQVPMTNDKIIIKNEIQTTGSVVSFTTDTTKQHMLDTNSQFTTNNHNLNTGML